MLKRAQPTTFIVIRTSHSTPTTCFSRTSGGWDQLKSNDWRSRYWQLWFITQNLREVEPRSATGTRWVLVGKYNSVVMRSFRCWGRIGGRPARPPNFGDNQLLPPLTNHRRPDHPSGGRESPSPNPISLFPCSPKIRMPAQQEAGTSDGRQAAIGCTIAGTHAARAPARW
jgi:hypothetical protein